MQTTIRVIPNQKQIALVAHDHCKQTLLDWVKKHKKRFLNISFMQRVQQGICLHAKRA